MSRLLPLLVLWLLQSDPLADALKRIDEETLKAHEKFLASDELEGRAAGYPGNEKAVEYIAKEVKSYGLKPAGEDGGYTQEFEFGRGAGRKAKNVIAMLEGSDSKLKSEYVVIGAHLDHVGKKGQRVGGQVGGSNDDDGIWNGADDNGSGTSAVLAVARAYGQGAVKPRRSILFCWWNAEEAGLLGSRHWCANPTRPLDKVVYNLNLDMVGRNPDRPVDIEGVKNAEGDALEKIIMAACESEKLKATYYDHHNEAMFRSDGASFLQKGIAASMFFSYWHDDYHRVGDHAEKIAYDNLAKIGRTAFRILLGVANLDEPLKFNEDTPLRGGGGGGRQLGINGEELQDDDLAELKLGEGNGAYRVGTVAENSVAEKAGLESDDIIIGFGGKPLPAKGTLNELRRRIQGAKLGEEVEIEIIRGKERKKLKAVWPKK
ncbi:MAG: M20/M25/M40 family metallo-hydrolase [Planctomycetes bacterium]|nr:M20/M25/M40 family metallo-hydrolase [Planctomycetota bacterium]